jgi:hypothetical protein
MSERASLFAELKRRNVYKVAVAYVVVAWLLLQAASIFLPAFDSPSWVMKFLIVVIILGFPVVLILSWAFELTSEGIKLESEIAPNQSITRRTGRKIVGITIMLAVFAAGLMIFKSCAKPSADLGKDRRAFCRTADRKQVDRRPALREPESRPGERIFQRRHSGRNPDPAGQNRRFQSYLAHLDGEIQKRAREFTRDCSATRRRAYPGRKRAKVD